MRLEMKWLRICTILQQIQDGIFSHQFVPWLKRPKLYENEAGIGPEINWQVNWEANIQLGQTILFLKRQKRILNKKCLIQTNSRRLWFTFLASTFKRCLWSQTPHNNSLRRMRDDNTRMRKKKMRWKNRVRKIMRMWK